MTIIEKYRKGEISSARLREYAARHHEQREDILALPDNGEPPDADLNGVVGGSGLQSVRQPYDAGEMTIGLTGAGGNPMAITDGVWGENGGPHLPEGSGGAVRNQHQVP